MIAAPETPVTGLTLAHWCRDLDIALPEHLRDRPVTGIAVDSRQVTPGDCFLVYHLRRGGDRRHGGAYISAALTNGARLVLVDAGIDRAMCHIPRERAEEVVFVAGLTRHIGELCARFFDHPAAHMPVVAITGTNGKTSCAHFLAQAPALAGRRPGGLIGTPGWGLLNDLQNTLHTTPDPLELQYRLSRLLQHRPGLVAVEASSHALDQRRTAGCRFRVAAFTNLSQDHLDYHLNMHAYARAKLKLFTEHEVGCAVVAVDDAHGRWIVEQLERAGGHGRPLRTSARADSGADVVVTAVAARKATPAHAGGMRIRVVSPWGRASLQTRLLGEFNLPNLATVTACLGALEWSWSEIKQALTGFVPVPGRMQMLPRVEGRPRVIVDYAHTPDALQTVLSSARALAAGKLVCVFGCGGERDRDKRSLMGAAAGRLADAVVVTSDNPRREAPERIIADILAGIHPDSNVVSIPDRRQAIAQALREADAGDVVVIAGKGHERYQLIGRRRLAFDDAAIAAQLLEAGA